MSIFLCALRKNIVLVQILVFISIWSIKLFYGLYIVLRVLRLYCNVSNICNVRKIRKYGLLSVLFTSTIFYPSNRDIYRQKKDSCNLLEVRYLVLKLNFTEDFTRSLVQSTDFLYVLLSAQYNLQK